MQEIAVKTAIRIFVVAAICAVGSCGRSVDGAPAVTPPVIVSLDDTLRHTLHIFTVCCWRKRACTSLLDDTNLTRIDDSPGGSLGVALAACDDSGVRCIISM